MAVNGAGYWYKHGKIIKLQNSIHVNDIINNPETFGLTKEYIIDTYKKYNELLGTEGNAREEIMIEAMKNGWLRVRKTLGKSGITWTVQFADYRKQKKDIKGLVEYLYIEKEEMKKNDDLFLLSYDGKTGEHYNSFIGKGIDTFLEQLKKEEKIIVERVNNYQCFSY